MLSMIRVAAIALTICLMGFSASRAFAAGINVDATCTLRQAIYSANNDNAVSNSDCEDGSGADTIYITEDATSNGVYAVQWHLHIITTEITIEGNNFTIDGGDKYDIFRASENAKLTLNNMTLTRGAVDTVGNLLYIDSNAIVNINNSSLTDSHSNRNGGGLYLHDGSLTIENSTISNNSAETDGGGIYAQGGTVTIRNSVIRDNSAKSKGGGIVIRTDVRLTIENSTIANNSATGNGGGIYSIGRENLGKVELATVIIKKSTIAGNISTGGHGGGILLDRTRATIEQSSIVGNSSPNGNGGGLHLYNTSATIENSTISVNSVTNGNGGALYDDRFNRITLTHVTVANNSANENRNGGLRLGSLNAGKLYNSIVAGNTGTDCTGSLDEHFGNLIENSGGCATPAITGDPMLGDLIGSPAYHPLQSGSPAMDAADSSYCTAKDQRDLTRPQGDDCDIGAYEFGVSSADTAKPINIPTQQVPTCLALLPEIDVTDLTGATECQRIDAEGIGIQSVIDMGIVDAVDVWGYLGAGTRVCFQASGGSFSFLAADDAPRSIRSLPLQIIDGKACTFIDRHGSVILHPGLGVASASVLPVSPRGSQNCMVMTTHPLNFRGSPGGQIIRRLGTRVTLTVLSRIPDWVEVDYYGEAGWISADYVVERGSCD